MQTRYVDDYELVQECRKGNADAYGILLDRVEPKMVSHVQSKVHSRDAPDVIQEVFTAIVRCINEDRYLGRSALETYFYKIVINKVADYYRKCRRSREYLSESDELPEVTEKESPWDLVDNNILLQQLSSKLSGENMEVVKLKLAGWNFNEISEIVGASYEGTRSRYRRGIKKIQERASIYRSIELRRRY